MQIPIDMSLNGNGTSFLGVSCACQNCACVEFRHFLALALIASAVIENLLLEHIEQMCPLPLLVRFLEQLKKIYGHGKTSSKCGEIIVQTISHISVHPESRSTGSP